MSYKVHSIFPTIQGEGFHAGRAAVFVRFQLCNQWTGREEDRGKGGSCAAWCDSKFVGGADYPDSESLATAAESLWTSGLDDRLCVLTGGEPALQADAPLVAALHRRGFTVAIETNGTRQLAIGIDWVTLSPKAGTILVLKRADELKLVYPQADFEPDRFRRDQYPRRYLQPMDGPDLASNTAAAIAYCLANPGWRLSVQAQKTWGIA